MPTINNLKILYDLDDYQWLEDTIKILIERDFASLDVENLIEELEELGREKKNAVASLLEQIIRHYLMSQYWLLERERNRNHWRAEVYNFKVQLNRLLTRTLQIYLAENFDKIYQNSCKYIQKKASLDNLPAQNPYALEELLNEDHFPDSDHPTIPNGDR